MNKQNNHLEKAALLRQKAEEKLKLHTNAASKVSTETDMLKLIHELEVHQIELEMQNEELVIAKEKAELAEEKYTELYDFAPSGYVALSEKGEILELNFAVANMLGKERSKLIKNRFDLFISIDTQITFNLFLHDVFKNKVKQTCEVIIATEGKLPIYVNIDGIVSQNNEMCLLTLHDITESIRAKKELQGSEEKYRISEIELLKAQEIAHLGSWYLDLNTNEVVWTKELYKMYGFDHTLPPPPYTEHMKLFTPESWEILSTSLAKTREEGIPYELELKTIRKDNSNGWMWVRGEAVLDENNKIIGLWGAAQEITERKKTEEMLLAKVDELERFFKIIVGRETAMIALKNEVNSLLNKLGQDNKYTIHE